jgi:hypothetical protein
MCDYCADPLADQVCERCHSVLYCNEICQRAHWQSEHKTKCVDVNEIDHEALVGELMRGDELAQEIGREILREPECAFLIGAGVAMVSERSSETLATIGPKEKEKESFLSSLRQKKKTKKGRSLLRRSKRRRRRGNFAKGALAGGAAALLLMEKQK